MFHPGELAVQSRAGLREQADRVGRMVRASIPAVAAEFLAQRPMLVVGAADETGQMWASVLAGPPAFLTAYNEPDVRAADGHGEPEAAERGESDEPEAGERGEAGEHGEAHERGFVEIAARPLRTDPLASALARHGTRLGAIALDPENRRRMRINGVVEPTAGGLLLRAEQVYANCPKYIQRRFPEWVDTVSEPVTHRGLDAPARRIIEGADTFFVATADRTGDADASHRGGNPGFVRIVGDDELAWSDYPGNALMQTLGNIERNPSTGLLFLDWATGTTLQLSGSARIEWVGTEREVRFRPRRVVRTEHALPLRWGPPEPSRFNPPTSASAAV